MVILYRITMFCTSAIRCTMDGIIVALPDVLLL
jgi:hypothetical protein